MDPRRQRFLRHDLRRIQTGHTHGSTKLFSYKLFQAPTQNTISSRSLRMDIYRNGLSSQEPRFMLMMLDFSTVGALKSHWNILGKGRNQTFSEQQLFDCAGAFDNHVCNGGLPSHAFEYIRYAGGIQSDLTILTLPRTELASSEKT